MSLSSIVVRGYGSFGSATLLPVLGYAASVAVGPGICATGSAYIPGASAGACYNAGAFEGGVFVPMITMVGGYVAGANEGAVYVPGASAGDDY